MNTIIGLWFCASALLTAAGLQAQASPPPSGAQAKQAGTQTGQTKKGETPDAKRGQAGKSDEKIEDPLQERVENGVLVVRRSIRRGDEGDKAKEGDSQGVLKPAAPPTHRSYRLYRVRNDDAWRYSRPRERSQPELQRSWQYRRNNQKYQPPPRRSQEDVERLWKYRKR